MNTYRDQADEEGEGEDNSDPIRFDRPDSVQRIFGEKQKNLTSERRFQKTNKGSSQTDEEIIMTFFQLQQHVGPT